MAKQHQKFFRGRLFRWSILLQNLKFNVIHKPGKANINADILSRLDYGPPPPPDPDNEFLDDTIQIVSVDDLNEENILNLDESEYEDFQEQENQSGNSAIAYFSCRKNF